MKTAITRTRLIVSLAALSAAAGCTNTEFVPKPITNVQIPVKDTTPKVKAPEREMPPGSSAAKEYRFPTPTWVELGTGLKVATLANNALPLVHVRVIVQGGKAADGERPGLASITGQMLKDGGAGGLSSRDLVTRIESLGANLSIETGFDSTVISVSVLKDKLGEALDLVGSVVREPQFNSAEFDKLKKREIDRTADAARTSGRWGAMMVLWRDLFVLPSDHHPYATYDATPADVAKLTVNDCRALHKKLFVPKNTFVVIAGDTTPDAAKAAAEKAFGSYKGGEAPVISFTDPMPPETLKITLVDRPKSSQSDIYAGILGLDRADKQWASWAVANQVLGGGVSGRLFLDVREKQSLAYNTRSSVIELSHGPSVLTAYAGTQTAKTGLALKAVLDNLERLGQSAAEEQEVETARRYLADVFAIKLETIGAVADEIVHLRLLGLPDDYDDGYRKELRDVTPALALKAASDRIRAGHEVVVVAGDAKIIGPMLSHFGDVKVVDPTKGFERVRTIPKDANAPLEVDREVGK